MRGEAHRTDDNSEAPGSNRIPHAPAPSCLFSNYQSGNRTWDEESQVGLKGYVKGKGRDWSGRERPCGKCAASLMSDGSFLG